MEAATLARRMAARAIDALPWVVVGVAYVVAEWDVIVDAAENGTDPELNFDWPWRMGWVVPFVYEVAFVRWFGGTFGKLLLGSRVVAVDGGRPSWTSAARRAFVYGLVPLSLLWLVVRSDQIGALSQLGQLALLFTILRDPDGRGLHDRWSGTRVINRR